MTSLHEVNPNRPYSQLELENTRRRNYKKLRINPKLYAVHEDTKYFYRVKKFSKKEKEILANTGNIGNCSMSWNIRNNSRHKDNDFLDVRLNDYLNAFEPEALEGKKVRLTPYLLDIEYEILEWLTTSF